MADGTGRGRGEGPEVVFDQLDVRHLFNMPVWQSGGPLQIVGEIEMTERMINGHLSFFFSLLCPPGCDVMPCFYNPVINCVRPSDKVANSVIKNVRPPLTHTHRHRHTLGMLVPLSTGFLFALFHQVVLFTLSSLNGTWHRTKLWPGSLRKKSKIPLSNHHSPHPLP